MELKKPKKAIKLYAAVTLSLHVIMSCFVPFKPLAYTTSLVFFFFFFKVWLCQCSCYVAEDQQFQWLEKVKPARQQIE